MPIGCARNQCCYCHSNVPTGLWVVAVLGHHAKELHAHALPVNSAFKDRTNSAVSLSAVLCFAVVLKGKTHGMLC